MNKLETEINNIFKRKVIVLDELIEFISGKILEGDEDEFWLDEWNCTTGKKLQAQFNIKEENN